MWINVGDTYFARWASIRENGRQGMGGKPAHAELRVSLKACNCRYCKEIHGATQSLCGLPIFGTLGHLMPWAPRILSEFEIGQAMAAIESVARSGKPLAEVGCRAGNLADIEHDLTACLGSLRDAADVKIWMREAGDRVRFGFYIQPWVLEALTFVETADVSAVDRHWINGLLFGYRPEAIQQFIDARQGARAAGDESLAPASSRQPSHTHNSDQNAPLRGIRSGTRR